MCSRQIGANFSQIGAKMKNSWVATTQFLPSQNWSRQGFRTPKLPLCSIIISNQQQPFLRFVCLVVGLKNRTIYSANAGEFNGDESHQIESESFKNHQLTKHPQNLPSWSPRLSPNRFGTHFQTFQRRGPRSWSERRIFPCFFRGSRIQEWWSSYLDLRVTIWSTNPNNHIHHIHYIYIYM